MAEDQSIELPQVEGRPLVTFALFAYNQEKYIREAVEGAFAQTYDPLEIILSDDCSTDRTFEIMEEMALAYKGPHKILIRKSPVNRGLGLHILDVSELMNGHYVIVAGGDDISLPHRTIALIKTMHKERRKLAASNYNRMSEFGKIEEYNITNCYESNYLWKIIDSNANYFVLGCTAAYEKYFFVSALKSAKNTIEKGYLFNEDDLFSAFAVATNEKPAEYASSALVNYRAGTTSLSSQTQASKTLEDEERKIQTERFRSQTRLALLEAVIEMACNYPFLNKKLNKEKIFKDLHLSEMEIYSSEPSITKRLYSLSRIKSIVDLKIWIVRVLGTKFHARLRWHLKKPTT